MSFSPYFSFAGINCEIDTDECLSNPCIHGKCTNELNRYKCYCDDAYTGTNCETKLAPCQSNPCVHGTCKPINRYTDYQCHCPPGFEGNKSIIFIILHCNTNCFILKKKKVCYF